MSSGSTLDAGDAAVGNVTETGRPWWPIGLAVVALVFVLLVGAVLIGRQLQPRLGVDPAPAVLPAVQATRAPAVVPQVTVAAGAAPTAATVGASALPPGVRVATTPLEREVEDAYLRYWEVLKFAYLNLDTSRLNEVMAGAELSRQEAVIRDLQAKGRAARLEVDHRMAFANVSSERAVVYDEYLNRSVFIDPATKQEFATREPPSVEKISFELRKVSGSWKVVDGARHD